MLERIVALLIEQINTSNLYICWRARSLASNYNRNSSAITKHAVIYLVSRARIVAALSNGCKKLPAWSAIDQREKERESQVCGTGSPARRPRFFFAGDTATRRHRATSSRAGGRKKEQRVEVAKWKPRRASPANQPGEPVVLTIGQQSEIKFSGLPASLAHATRYTLCS